MPEMDEDGYFSIGKVVVPGLFNQEIKCTSRPAPTELNILSILCEHVNKVIDYNVILDRLGITANSLHIWITKLNKTLHPDWWIHSIAKKGFRIIYIGGLFTSAERSYFIMDVEAVRSRHTTKDNIKLLRLKALATREFAEESIKIEEPLEIKRIRLEN
jgi:hypothetical protein